MERLLGTKAVPPGFRFYPTDEELFMYYLKRKVMGRSLQPDMIAEVDVYRFAPWDLPAMACLKTRDLNWFFFCPRAKKYPKGGRANRATECGYWKSTGNDRTVYYHSRPVGKIKTLVFHRGKAPAGERTDWVMHEYRLEDNDLVAKGVPQDSYVICKIYEKSGMGPKNGETYGARFIEEEWDSDNDDNGRGAGSEVMVQSPDVSVSAVDNPSVAHAVITPINAAVTVAIVDDPLTTFEPAVATVDGAATTFEPAVATVVDAATTFEPAVATTYATASAADTTSAPAFAATTAASAPAAPATVPLSASEEEEMDWLLSYLTPEGDIGDIYDGLGDLCSPPRMDNLDWRIPFIEMDDLNSQLK